MTKPRRDPKSLSGSRKPPLHLFPPVAAIEAAMALKSGAPKHGSWNWRKQRVEMMEHLGAALRHIGRSIDGENADPESNVDPLAHAIATLAVVIDAKHCGTLIDDRPPKGGAAAALARHTRKRRTA